MKHNSRGYSKPGLAFLLAVLTLAGLAALPLDRDGHGRFGRDGDEARERYMPVAGERGESDELGRMEQFWNDRLTYPTGLFNPAWLRAAALQDKLVPRAGPRSLATAAAAASQPKIGDNARQVLYYPYIGLGPKPEHMTGCSGCYDYTTTSGRVNSIAIDPTTTTAGSIVAYAATVGGGVWKTTNCCTATTTWAPTTDGDPLLATVSMDAVTLDPNDHRTIYAGTGDLNFGSFSMGSQGILKSTNAGASWTLLGANIFGPALAEPAGKFPQYNAVGKVKVDPNNSARVVAGTKEGLFISYDGGANWTGPCTTNTFVTQRQDITGLELSNMGGGVTRIVAAVGVRGFATPVQYNLDQNGANGLYKANMPTAGCPVFSSITTNTNGWASQNATSGNPYGAGATGNKLGRIDIAVAPSNPAYIYAQVQSIADNGCGAAGCQLGAWRTTDGGTTWTSIPGSDGGSLLDCSGMSGDYNQNWYDQGVAVHPTDPNRVVFDTFDVWYWDGTNPVTQNLPWNDVTCGYSLTGNNGVHVDQHALAFSADGSTLLLGNDGGVHYTTDVATMNAGTDPTFTNMDGGFNTIEFYAGDISGNFATSATPMANGGAQDNGASAVQFSGQPTAPAQWQMGLGGDGFSGQIDPLGKVFFQGNNSGGLSRCTTGCTAPNATWSSIKGGWGSDQQSFVLPVNLFHGGIPGGDDCSATTCNHMLAATTRVFETVTAASAGSWYITNNPAGAAAGPNLTKGTLGNRSYINQVKYSPKYQTVAIVGTNDGNVQIGFNLGTGTAGQANWVNVTGSNATLPNRPIIGVTLSPAATARDLPIGYAGVGGFNANTPTTPGHVFEVTCTSNCATFSWLDKTGNLPDIPVDAIVVNPNIPKQVYAGTDWGVYFTDDITASTPTWQRFENGLPHSMVWDFAIDRGSTTLSVWTRGRGAWVYRLPVPNQPPAVTLSSDVSSGIAVFPVTFTFSATDPNVDVGDFVTLDLDFGDGSPHSSAASPVTHTYRSPGTYTVTLTATDSEGLTGVKTLTITANPDSLPVPTLTATPASGIAVFDVDFTVNATDADAGDALTYDLDFGDGSPHGAASGSVTHTYATAGTYTVTLLVTDSHEGTGTRTATITAAPDQLPVASLTPSATLVQTATAMSFEVTGTDADAGAGDTLSFDLDFGDGSTHSTASGTVPHAYASSGTYTVTLTVRDLHGGVATKTATIVADGFPTASLSPAAITIEAGNPVNFTAGGSDPDTGDTLSYDLDFADGTVHGTAPGAVSHVYTAGGTFLASLTVTDSHGAKATRVSSVTVKAPPQIGDTGVGALGWFTLTPLAALAALRRRRHPKS